MELEDARFPNVFNDRLVPILRESDLVKFAKHVPDYNLCDTHVDLGFELVIMTKPQPQPEVEAAEEKAA
jgi:hypothetical protein